VLSPWEEGPGNKASGHSVNRTLDQMARRCGLPCCVHGGSPLGSSRLACVGGRAGGGAKEARHSAAQRLDEQGAADDVGGRLRGARQPRGGVVVAWARRVCGWGVLSMCRGVCAAKGPKLLPVWQALKARRGSCTTC
jgi:hypothetical protein